MGEQRTAEPGRSLLTDDEHAVESIEAGEVFLYGGIDASNATVSYEEDRVKKTKALTGFIFSIALVTAVLSGCGGSADTRGTVSSAQSEVQSEAQSSPRAGQAAVEETQSEEDAMYSTRELSVENDGQSIYGVAYVPDGANADARAPLVILSHGLGGTHSATVPYAQELASHGYAAYVFDFCGGAPESQSDGKTTSMSVMTEASDLEAVMDAAAGWDFADTSKLILAGESQGGMVSAVVAARRPQDVSALVLLYPALSIVDDAHAQFSSKKDVPKTYELFGWMTVGRNYATDVWDYDVYGEIAKYEGPVLIEHGSEDSVVDVSYSRRAAKAYSNATLNVLEGAGHGFTGSDFDKSVDDMLVFLDEHTRN